MAVERCVIRLAAPADTLLLPAIEKRAARLFGEWLAATGLTAEHLEHACAPEEFDAACRRGQLWVAESADDGVVGFALVSMIGSQPHLHELDVVPEHGRRGVGSELLHAVCRWAGDAGHAAVTLSTFRDVPWNAPFYARRGFRVVAPERLSPAHVELVAAERSRGLRTDLRVLMAYDLAAGPPHSIGPYRGP